MQNFLQISNLKKSFFLLKNFFHKIKILFFFKKKTKKFVSNDSIEKFFIKKIKIFEKK